MLRTGHSGEITEVLALAGEKRKEELFTDEWAEIAEVFSVL